MVPATGQLLGSPRSTKEKEAWAFRDAHWHLCVARSRSGSTRGDVAA
jgi:hypothetical protein